MSEQKIRNVIDTFRRIVSADGGELELTAVTTNDVSVRYRPGHNEECESCVLTPSDLQLLLLEAIQRQVPEVRAVHITSG